MSKLAYEIVVGLILGGIFLGCAQAVIGSFISAPKGALILSAIFAPIVLGAFWSGFYVLGAIGIVGLIAVIIIAVWSQPQPEQDGRGSAGDNSET